jgi:hypothetical protein
MMVPANTLVSMPNRGELMCIRLDVARETPNNPIPWSTNLLQKPTIFTRIVKK